MSTTIGLLVYLGLAFWLYLLGGHGRFIACLVALSLPAGYLTSRI